MFDIKITYSSVHHSQSNGSLERFHSTLLELIRMHLYENSSEHPFSILPYATIAYNNSVNNTHVFTPYELIFEHTSSRLTETLYNQQEIITKYVTDLDSRISHYYKIAQERAEH